MREICWRYQELRADRLVFSCECAGEGCPDEPRVTRFIVTTMGEVNVEPDSITEPEPDDEDRRKARWLAEGGGFDSDAEDLFARGMAVTRSGGDVRAFLREQLTARRPT